MLDVSHVPLLLVCLGGSGCVQGSKRQLYFPFSIRNLKIGYFSQHHVDQLDLNVCSIELLLNKFPGDHHQNIPILIIIKAWAVFIRHQMQRKLIGTEMGYLDLVQ